MHRFRSKAGSILPTTRHMRCASRRCAGMVIDRAIVYRLSIAAAHARPRPSGQRVLPKCHDIRNRSEYGGDFAIDERIVADLVTACQTVSVKVDSLRSIGNP